MILKLTVRQHQIITQTRPMPSTHQHMEGNIVTITIPADKLIDHLLLIIDLLYSSGKDTVSKLDAIEAELQGGR